MRSTHVPVALQRGTVTSLGLRVVGAAASAPLVVLVGGIVTTFAATGVVALPLVFVAVTVVVGLLAVGYAAMAVRVGHPAAYYGILTAGLGRRWGVAGGLVALLAYNAIQISLYGLLGSVAAAAVSGVWWVWALVALVVVGWLGVHTIVTSTRVVAAVLLLSLLVVALFVVAGLGEPAAGGGSPWAGFSVAQLTVGGVGGACALCVAALMGFDVPGSLGEEATDRGAIYRATVGGVLLLGGVYAVASWAMGVAVGPRAVAAVAADGGLPFSVLGRLGGWLVVLAEVLLIAAIVTSMLVFHHTVARYVFAMSREQVLPGRLAQSSTGRQVAAPREASLAQSILAAVVVGAFAVAGLDPLVMFAWLSALGAMGLLCLLLAASVAALSAPQALRGERWSWWQWRIAPTLGVLGGLGVLAVMVVNADSLLGAAPGSLYPLLLPAALTVTALMGAAWGARLQRSRPDISAGIGQGQPRRNEVPDNISESI
ncbi:APC family permease [Micromonospora aurantiaca (nom. illeg.)]|uniref:APC family permease n=1 Tax=Micromonospora aurantiaca (nom. illeg.) TaxID=47850 RepID=UPI003401DF5A